MGDPAAAGGSPHWLADRVAALESLHRADRASGRRPEAFIEAVTLLVGELAARPGVGVAFAAIDGLPVAAAGEGPSAEALAAVAQELVAAAQLRAEAVKLGGVRQLVVVGEAHKLALLGVGPLLLGLWSPVATDLGQATARAADPLRV